jgi:hypothetical protein
MNPTELFRALFASLAEATCQDNSCEVARPRVGTNGGCGCTERTLRRALRIAKARIVELERAAAAPPAPLDDVEAAQAALATIERASEALYKIIQDGQGIPIGGLGEIDYGVQGIREEIEMLRWKRDREAQP